MLEILYQDKSLLVCVKPAGVDSEDGSGANTMPALLRSAANMAEDAAIFTVHRLDKQVGGVMVYAKTKPAAAALSAQMQAHTFEKEYRAVLEGVLCAQIDENPQNTAENVPCGTAAQRAVCSETSPETSEMPAGRWEDLLYHDKRKHKVFCVKKMRKGVKSAALRYQVLEVVTATTQQGAPTAAGATAQGSSKTAQKPLPFSLLKINLETGRTHQIRVQSASRKHPLVGDARYGSQTKGCNIALFSHKIGFYHPTTRAWLSFVKEPPATYPWTLFDTP